MTAPPSKSHAIRGLLCAAMATPETAGGPSSCAVLLSPGALDVAVDPATVGVAAATSGPTDPGADVRDAVGALAALGPPGTVVREGDVYRVRPLPRVAPGSVLPALPSDVFLTLGGSATALRLFAAAVALGPGPTTLGGSPQRLRRPAGAVVPALRAFGVTVKGACGERGIAPPLVVAGGPPRSPRAPLVVDASASSHGLSAVLLVGPFLPDGLRVRPAGEIASRPYVDLTVEVLRTFGATVEEREGTFVVAPGGLRVPPGGTFPVEGDWSSAAYLLGAAAATGGDVTVTGLSLRSTQADRRVTDVLVAFGADVSEVPGGVRVRGGPLRGVDVDLRAAPDLAPLVGALGCRATGETRVRGAAHLRWKETDRIASVVAAATSLGCPAEPLPDGFVVRGGAGAVPPGTVVPTEGDHRLAMAFAVAALGRPGVRIEEPECVAKSWPGFWEALGSLVPPDGTGR